MPTTVLNPASRAEDAWYWCPGKPRVTPTSESSEAPISPGKMRQALGNVKIAGDIAAVRAALKQCFPVDAAAVLPGASTD
jgi:hypothetical protein